jgi:hypothetical protein
VTSAATERRVSRIAAAREVESRLREYLGRNGRCGCPFPLPLRRYLGRFQCAYCLRVVERDGQP